MIRKFLPKGIIAVAVLTASTGVLSREISYNFVQGTFVSSTVDTGFEDVDATGIGVSGSFVITPNIALTAGFGTTSFDTFLGVDIDTTELSFGVTGYTSVAEGTSVFGNFSVLKANIEATDGFNTIDDDDTGNVISVGLRHMATDAVEIEAGFSRVDVFDESGNTFGIGIRFYANDKFSLGVGYATGDDVDSLILNARFNI